jgi:hypothetical protein
MGKSLEIISEVHPKKNEEDQQKLTNVTYQCKNIGIYIYIYIYEDLQVSSSITFINMGWDDQSYSLCFTNAEGNFIRIHTKKKN